MQLLVGRLVHQRDALGVLRLASAVPPAARPRTERQVVAGRSGQALDIGVIERQSVGRDVVGLECHSRIEGRLP